MPSPIGLSYASTETMESTLGDIVVSVDSATGSDTPTVSRQARVLFGDHDAEPFETLQAAIDSIPRLLRHNVRINLAVESIVGGFFRGFSGYGLLQLVGQWLLATPTTGDASGTAGSGSGGTLVNKPTGSDDYVVDELRGKYFVITGGGGFEGTDPKTEAVGLIVSNTVDAITLAEALPGLDGTTEFEICDHGSILNDSAPFVTNDDETLIVGGAHMNCDFRLHRLKVDNSVALADNTAFVEHMSKLTMRNVGLKTGDVNFSHSQRLQATNMLLEEDVFFNTFRMDAINALNWVVNDSSTTIEIFTNADILNYNQRANSGIVGGLLIRNGQVCTLGAAISECTALPLQLKTIGHFSVNGSVSGANPGTLRGVQIDGGGIYDMPGMTIAGSSAFPVFYEDIELNYAQISGNGAQWEKGTQLVSGTGYNSLPGFGIIVGGSLQSYGLSHNLGNSGAERVNITAKAGGGLADDTPHLGYKNTIVTAAASPGDSIRFFGRVVAMLPDPPSAEVFPSPAMMGMVFNGTAVALNLFPQETTRQIFVNGVGLGLGVALSIPAGKAALWMSWGATAGVTDVDWYVVVLP